ncbi:MAG: hypothetical protein C0505_12485 [Leptothrix sp. (in: Bacteria)]|nr:hypothetical protein [Leptothrix sp. (in: b-proteobacteria)]
MPTLSVHTPLPVTMPRGAPVAAALFTQLLDVFQAARAALAASRQHAARQADVRALRRYAQSVYRDDPRFAADLLAAADRHEIEGLPAAQRTAG